ncbi:MAG TPA: tRNA epoxyqueuosine(34) reductase QueG [Burkholderiaceae bacterium]|nr:tRNA epoxyqueuosine(34) reductase QueG [Burkholderiaceae bacterium]
MNEKSVEEIGRAAKDSGAPGPAPSAAALARLTANLKSWGRELGFGAVCVAPIDTRAASQDLAAWLAAGCHGDMDYMAHHAALRADPATLLPGAVCVITARMDYRPRGDDSNWIEREWTRLHDGAEAVVSAYARGRDYHKVLRGKLRQLVARIEAQTPGFRYRVCTDSAPVFEVDFARGAGLGWRGKHTLLLTRDAGSMFFLGEILTTLPLPVDAPVSDHCGTCTRCIDVCPTRAITAPYRLDARRCISYLTIEHRGAIPVELRPLIGNRVYGCDDCQLACPWNRFARTAELPDFDVRNGLDRATLIELFAWSEEDFRARHAGSAILRIGYERWLRNLAVGLGNAPASPAVIAALEARRDHPSALVREHVAWALTRHGADHPGSQAQLKISARP